MTTACGSGHVAPAPPAEPGIFGYAPDPAPTVHGIDAADTLAEVAEELPAATSGVVVVDVRGLLTRVLAEGGGVMSESWDPKPMLDQLGAFSRARLGLDVTAVRRAVVALSGDDVLLLVDEQAPLEAKPGSVSLFTIGPKSGAIYTIHDAPVAAATLRAEGWTMLGIPSAVVHARGAIGGGAPSLATTERYAKTRALMAQLGPTLVSAAGAFAARDAATPGHLPWVSRFDAPPERAVVALTPTQLALVAQGSPDALAKLEQRIQRALAKLRAEPEAWSAQLDALDAWEGMSAIAQAHMMRGLEAQLTPRRRGDLLIVSAPMPAGLVQTLPWLGGAGLVFAAPALERRLRETQHSEATGHLTALTSGAILSYYATHDDATARRFPPSARSMPASIKSCCAAHGAPDADHDGRCDAMDGAAWQARGFAPYDFAPKGPTRFVYETLNNGKTGADAELTLHAHGDLDCDGVVSTYTVRLVVDAEGQPDAIFVRMPAGFEAK